MKPVTIPPTRVLLVVLLTLLALTGALWSANARAEDGSADVGPPTGRDAEILAGEHQVQRIASALPGELEAFRLQRAAHQRRLDRIVATEGLVAHNPWDMSSQLRRLETLRRDLEQSARPLVRLREQLDELVAGTNEIATELQAAAGQLSDDAARTTALASGARAAAVARRAEGLRAKLVAATRPSEALAKTLDGRIADYRGQLGLAWKAYYLEPDRSYSSLAGLAHLATQTKLWATRLPRAAKAFAPSREAWLDLAQNTVLFITLAWAAGAFTIRRLRSRWPSWTDQPLQRHWVWVAFGLGLLVAGMMAARARQDVLAVLGELTLTYGLLGMVWTSRRATSPEDGAPKFSPLHGLWLVFALGAVLQVTGLPAGALTIVWCLATVPLVRHLLRAAQRGAPRLERLALAASPWLLAAAAVTAALGWAQLAVTVCSSWFVLTLGGQIAATLQGGLSRWRRETVETGGRTLARGVALGVGYPAAWLVGLAGLPLWLSPRVGEENLLWLVLHKDLGWGPVSVSLLRVVAIVIGFFLVRVALAAAREAIERLYPREEDGERGAADSLATVATYVGWILYGFAALLMLGVSFTSVAVIAGGLSVGIGFGLQNIVNNLVSGVLLLVGGSIRTGDVLQIGDLFGVVQRVTIRNTIVRTYDNSTLFVPNSDLVSNRVTNWTHRDRRVRRDVLVGVAYGSDTALAKRLLLEVAEGHDLVLDDPAPIVLFTAFGESSLDFMLRVWVDDFDHSLSVPSDLRDRIDQAFRAHDIEISFPQRDLHVRSAPGLSGALGGVLGGGATAGAEGAT